MINSIIPKFRNWQPGSIFCYERGCNCQGCPTQKIMETKCRMKSAVIGLVRLYGPPQKNSEEMVINQEDKEDKTMFDEDLQLEYSEYLKPTVNAIKQGYETLKDIAKNANISPHNASVYVDTFFQTLSKKGYLSQEPNKSRRQSLCDFIQSRLLDKNYTKQEECCYPPDAEQKSDDKKELTVNTSDLQNEIKRLNETIYNLNIRIKELETEQKSVNFEQIKNKLRTDINKLVEKLKAIEDIEALVNGGWVNAE